MAMAMNRDKVWTPIFLALLMLLSTTATPLLSEILQSEEYPESDVLEPEWQPRQAVRGEGSNMILAEVLFDPLGDDLGSETIAIRNARSGHVDLAGWQVVDEQKNPVFIFDEGYVIDSFSTVYIHLYPGLDSWSESSDRSIKEVYLIGQEYNQEVSQVDGLLSNARGSLALYSGNPSETNIVDYVRWGGESRSMSGATLDAYSAELWHPSEFVDISDSAEGQAIGTTSRYSRQGFLNWDSMSVDSSSVVINEILINTDEYQWVELYNPGPGTQQLDNWLLANTEDIFHKFQTGTAIQPGERIVVDLVGGDNIDRGVQRAPKSSFIDHYVRGTGDVSNPLNSSDEQVILAMPTSEGNGVIVDYVEWGHPPSNALHQLAVDQGHWSDGATINTSNMESPESLGRDKDGTDSNSINDWSLDGGEDANSPTRGRMNKYRIVLEAQEWNDLNKVALIQNNGSSIDVSGWNFANVTLGNQILIPEGVVIPRDAVLEVHFDEGVDDIDFSDGVAEIHVGTPFELKDTGTDVIFLRSSSNRLNDLLGTIAFLNGSLPSDGTEGTEGRCWGFSCSLCEDFVDAVTSGVAELLEDTLSGLVDAADWTISQLNEAFEDFVEWLAEFGMEIIDDLIDDFTDTFKNYIKYPLDSIFDFDLDYVFPGPSMESFSFPDAFSLDKINIDQAPIGFEFPDNLDVFKEQYLEWLIAVKADFHWGPKSVNIGLGIEAKGGLTIGGELDITQICGFSAPTFQGALTATGGIDFDWDWEYVGLEIIAAVNGKLKYSNDGLELAIDAEIFVRGWIDGLGEATFERTFELYTHSWELESNPSVDLDSCDGVPGPYDLISQFGPKPIELAYTGFPYNISLVKLQSDETLSHEVFDSFGWVNSTIVHEPVDTGDGLESQLEIEFTPDYENVNWTENLSYVDSYQECSCDRTGIPLRLDVMNTGPVITDTVTVIARKTSNSSQSDTAIFNVPIYEEYRVFTQSPLGWGADVVGGDFVSGFRQDELSSIWLRITPPEGTMPGTIETLTVRVWSQSNSANNFRAEIEVVAPHVQPVSLWSDPVDPQTDDDWIATGDWQHGEPRDTPENESSTVWTSNLDSSASSGVSVLMSPVMDLSGHDQALLSFDEWYQIPQLEGFQRTLVTMLDLTSDEVWVLGPRGEWDSGGWIETNYLLPGEMLSSEVQFQFHYFSATGPSWDSFWLIKDIEILTCILPEWTLADFIDLNSGTPALLGGVGNYLTTLNNPTSEVISGLEIEWTFDMFVTVPQDSENFEQGSGGWDLGASWALDNDATTGVVTYSDDNVIDVEGALRGVPDSAGGNDENVLRAASVSTMKGASLVFTGQGDNNANRAELVSRPFTVTSNDDLSLKFDFGLSERVSARNVNIMASIDDGTTWFSGGDLSGYEGDGEGTWVGYDNTGWIHWLPIEIPLNFGGFESNNDYSSVLFKWSISNPSHLNSGDLVILDNMEILRTLRTTIHYDLESLQLNPGEEVSFTHNLNLTAYMDRATRYDVTIVQRTVSQEESRLSSHIRVPTAEIGIDSTLRESSWLNSDLELSATTSSGGLVDYYLSGDEELPIYLGSSLSKLDHRLNVDTTEFDGDYILISVYTDPWGHQAVDSVALSIDHDYPPVADFDLELAEIEIGEFLNVSAAGSSDDSGIVRYEWRIEGPENHTFDTPEINLELQNEGTYNLILTVYDVNDQSSTTETTFDVFRSFEGQDEPDDGTSDESISTDDGDSDRSSFVAGISKDSMIALLLVVIVILLGMFASQGKREDDE